MPCALQGYNGNTKPSAERETRPVGVYLQDEWNIRDNFKLTAGIRMDNLSFLNDIMRNQAIYDLDFNGMHIDTGAVAR